MWVWTGSTSSEIPQLGPWQTGVTYKKKQAGSLPGPKPLRLDELPPVWGEGQVGGGLSFRLSATPQWINIKEKEKCLVDSKKAVRLGFHTSETSHPSETSWAEPIHNSFLKNYQLLRRSCPSCRQPCSWASHSQACYLAGGLRWTHPFPFLLFSS